MAPLLIPVVTLVIALAGLVLAIFALVLIAAQRLDNAQLPARRRSDRDPDPVQRSSRVRARLIGVSNPDADPEPIPNYDPITQAHRDRIRHTEAVAESYGTPAIPYPVTDPLINTKPDANGYSGPDPLADIISNLISDPKTVYLTDFKSDRDS
jgi:hypothetical protein